MPRNMLRKKMNKKYNIIYADPPWSYKDKCKSGKRGAGFKYDTLSLNDLKKLKVNEIADKNCFLFLWTTFPMMQESLDLINSWGFIYKTVGFVWVKKNKKKNSLFWGMGAVGTRANAEACLMAVKGKPKRISAGVHSIIEAPIEQHSKKPDIVRDKIVELCGDLPKIELFARKTVDGWNALGYDIDESDIRDALK